MEADPHQRAINYTKKLEKEQKARKSSQMYWPDPTRSSHCQTRPDPSSHFQNPTRPEPAKSRLEAIPKQKRNIPAWKEADRKRPGGAKILFF